MIDAYLGAHHDAPLSVEEEEQLHEAEAELEAEAASPPRTARRRAGRADENVKERAE